MASYVHNPDDITPLMTSDTAPSPNVVSASSNLSNYPPYGAFTHTANSAVGQVWVTDTDITTGWIKFDFGVGNTHRVIKYTVSAYDGANIARSPKTWTLQGSNNDSDWDVLDTQTNVAAWIDLEMRTYSFSNTTAYRYYKMDFTANQGGTTYLIIGEIEFMAATGWTGKINGVTNPAKINGIPVANIAKVNGVASS